MQLCSLFQNAAQCPVEKSTTSVTAGCDGHSISDIAAKLYPSRRYNAAAVPSVALQFDADHAAVLNTGVTISADVLSLSDLAKTLIRYRYDAFNSC